MEHEQLVGTGSKQKAPTPSTFENVYTLLRTSFPDNWELPRVLLDQLSNPKKTANVQVLCRIARDCANLDEADELSDQVFLAPVRHAIAQIRGVAYELFSRAQNPECITLSLPGNTHAENEMVKWVCEPESMKKLAM